MITKKQPSASPETNLPKEGMMQIIGQNIRFARKKKKMSQVELAIACGWKKFPSRVSNYERGIREPKSAPLSKVAKVLDVSIEWLYRDHGIGGMLNVNEPVSTYKAVKYVPLLKATEIWAHIHNESTHPINYVPGINIEGDKSFAMMVEGDSMEVGGGVSFYNGMTIIVDPDIVPASHHFVVALVDKMPTFKELIIESGKRWLKPLNPRYPLLEIDQSTEIAGVLCLVFKAFP